MRIRTLLAAGVAAIGMSIGAYASTITVSLQSVLTSASGVSPALYNVNIYAKSNQGETSSGAGDGGISGFQFDVLSNGITGTLAHGS